jgi:hypothetical protein
MFLSIVVVLALVVPVGVYVSHGGGGGRVWGLVTAGEEVRGGGAYRTARATLWKRGAAPLTVRVAALSSFFLGQMILPGALAAVVGLLVTIVAVGHAKEIAVLVVVQLSAPTGLVVAAYLLAAGAAMLERAEDAAVKARRAARWALVHNLVLLAGLAAATAIERDAAAVVPALYACLSIGQALLVRRAADAIEAYTARQNEEPAPVEVEMQVLYEAR